MNDKLFSLPEDKQQAILKAGYRIFSQNSYKHSPVSEIAKEAGISKSLLFYYFKNKKDLYLYLWDYCLQLTIQYLEKYECYKQKDLFESMERGMKAKMEIMRLYPDIGKFVIRAFYEKDEDICKDIQESYHAYFNLKMDQKNLNFDVSQFKEGIDIEMMYKDMFYASEGYLWEMVQRNEVDVDQMERDFTELMKFWKSIYLRK